MAHTMRRWVRLAALAAALCLLARACPIAPWAAIAEAPSDPALSIDFSVQPRVMVAPGEVTMTFVIRNTTDLPVRNIYLASADGLLSEPIGLLGPGESQTVVRPHAVSQEELDAGGIAYTVSHDPAVAGAEKVTYSLRAAIIKSDAMPSVGFTRQLSSDAVPRGGVVTVTYKIANTGNVALNALRIRDSLGDFTGRLEQLGVGDSKTFISRVTLNEDSESAPSLEFSLASGESFTQSMDPAPIRIANGELDISFSVGRSVFENDTADAMLILTNSGDVDYSDITVLDDVYGGIIADAVRLPGGQGPVEIDHTYPVRGKGEYRWRITGMSSAGETLDLRTETLTLPIPDDARAVGIELSAVARTPRINRPGNVTFDFSIANNGSAMAKDCLLYEVNLGEIRRLAVLPTGAPTVLSTDYDVNESSQFIFCLNYTDAQGRQRTVTSAPIDIEIAPDGQTPQSARNGAGALDGQSVKMGGNSSTFIVLLIIAGATLTALLTILAVTSVRARRERLKRVAAEKQRIKTEMGKTGPYPTVNATLRKRMERRKRKAEASEQKTTEKG